MAAVVIEVAAVGIHTVASFEAAEGMCKLTVIDRSALFEAAASEFAETAPLEADCTGKSASFEVVVLIEHFAAVVALDTTN